MRENRPSGSEGGATELNRSLLPLSRCASTATCFRCCVHEWNLMRNWIRAFMPIALKAGGAPGSESVKTRLTDYIKVSTVVNE